jgi:hypothetical protein
VGVENEPIYREAAAQLESKVLSGSDLRPGRNREAGREGRRSERAFVPGLEIDPEPPSSVGARAPGRLEGAFRALLPDENGRLRDRSAAFVEDGAGQLPRRRPLPENGKEKDQGEKRSHATPPGEKNDSAASSGTQVQAPVPTRVC